jgi:haloacetate dehalogenase
MRNFIPGFAANKLDVGNNIHIAYEMAGSGPPLLLLHGYPQHRIMWRHIAPEMAKTHTVVVADLRGYGESSTPPDDEGHTAYAKRAMAQDMVSLMQKLGFAQFAVAGHDRGARVTHRLLRDHSQRVARAALLDIIPTTHFWDTLDLKVAVGYYHWMYLAQPAPQPENMIGADREAWIRKRVLRKWGDESKFEPEVVQSYVDAFTPDVLAASCADYRAGASTDITDDRADFDATKIDVPLLVLWGQKGIVGTCYDTLNVWKAYATKPSLVQGHAVPSGHFLPEEAASETLSAMKAFFLSSR